MKNIYLFLLTTLITYSTHAQTSLEYTGTNIYSLYGQTTKVGAIAKSDLALPHSTNNCGIIGDASNGISSNIGVVGTTKQNRTGSPNDYIGIYGDNISNNLQVSGGVYGGKFIAGNNFVGGASSGVEALSYSITNGTYTVGMSAFASNSLNTSLLGVVGVRGKSETGTSTLMIDYGVANPGGYFESNGGQGIYATTTGTHNYQIASNKISQAITGYSNQPGGSTTNIGVVGIANPSGITANNYGVFGRLIGFGSGTSLNTAIYGYDEINVSNTYAGYFRGKVYMSSNLTLVGVLTGNSSATFTGCVTASNLSCPSDSRFKKNIIPIENSLSNILKINGVRYDWKTKEFPEKQFSDKNQIGFIAQEIEKIFPEMVFTDEKGFKSVDYARLTPVLVEAIKELMLKNQKLENRLDKIEAILSMSASKK
jgi:Chaperone of endosialidase